MHSTLVPRVAAAMLAVAAQAAMAQVVMAGRDSQLNFDWFAGYANDIYGGVGQEADGNLFAIDGASLVGNDSANDDYPPTGNVWTASVGWDLRHQYQIEGSPSALNNTRKISASGSSSTNSAYSGIVTVSVSVASPGNLLALSFVNPVAQDFHFTGSVAQQGPQQRNSSSVVILDDSGNAVSIGTGAFNDNWDKTINLAAGVYTIQATAKSIAGGSESVGSSWNYSLEAVSAIPEPGTGLLMLAGLAMAGLRWRQRADALA
jgi:PEP-CTERM motif